MHDTLPRRRALARAALATLLAWATLLPGVEVRADERPTRPNILIAISDDQSWPHASAYGYEAVSTPAFDEVARRGVLFRNAYCASPGCSPSRAALLTGRHPWELAEAGTHASRFPKDLAVYPELLEKAGYVTGYTGKGWGPGDWKAGGRDRDPVGRAVGVRLAEAPDIAASRLDYAASFESFLGDVPEDRPFCFWFGAHEPHRGFRAGSGVEAGKRLEDIVVPPFLPDTPEVRSDIADYLLEIEWFDRHLGRMLRTLEEAGRLDDTIVIVTSDNGMPFPRAKANGYDSGVHVPLAISWPRAFSGERVSEDLVSLVDIAPTLLEAAGVATPEDMTGTSLLALLRSGKSGRIEPERDAVFASRERHSSSRHGNLGYPMRSLRNGSWLLVWNPRPDRWPAGHPAGVGRDAFGYYDIDGAPTKTLLVRRREDPAIARYFHLAVDKRPEWELFDLRADPGCIVNLAGSAEHAEELARLRERLLTRLRETGDPRALGDGEVWETYPRLRGAIRKFPAD